MEEQTTRFQLLATKLYNAALKGNIPSLLNLLQEDPLILNRCIIEKSGHFMQSPLHVAANHGHLEFAKILLSEKHELAEEVDQLKRRSPLHMASAKGHLEIVNALLAVNPNMCFARDLDGRNPVHLAAINGQVKVLEVLLQSKPQAVIEQTICGESVLHLCVKHSQLETLEFLLQTIDDGQLLNSKDGDGNTILHLAVAAKSYKTIKFLLKDKRMEKNALNSNGLTAMDMHMQSRKDASDHRDIWFLLWRAKVLKAKKLLKPKRSSRDWLERQRSALMVVASLIATMAFQAGINPPGGVWQDDGKDHKAGTSIMAHFNEEEYYKNIYNSFLFSNTLGLVSSLTVIFLLISGLPCQKVFIGILMVTMWVAVSATISTYTISVLFLANKSEDFSKIIKELSFTQFTVFIVNIAWVGLTGLIIFGHILRLVIKLLKKIIRLMIEALRNSQQRVRIFYPPV